MDNDKLVNDFAETQISAFEVAIKIVERFTKTRGGSYETKSSRAHGEYTPFLWDGNHLRIGGVVEGHPTWYWFAFDHTDSWFRSQLQSSNKTPDELISDLLNDLFSDVTLPFRGNLYTDISTVDYLLDKADELPPLKEA